MKQHTFRAAQRADLCEWLDNTDLVVRRHHRDQQRLLGEHRRQSVERDQAACFDRQISDTETLALKLKAAFEHAFVLGRQGYDLITGPPALRMKAGKVRGALDRQI